MGAQQIVNGAVPPGLQKVQLCSITNDNTFTTAQLAPWGVVSGLERLVDGGYISNTQAGEVEILRSGIYSFEADICLGYTSMMAADRALVYWQINGAGEINPVYANGTTTDKEHSIRCILGPTAFTGGLGLSVTLVVESENGYSWKFGPSDSTSLQSSSRVLIKLWE